MINRKLSLIPHRSELLTLFPSASLESLCSRWEAAAGAGAEDPECKSMQVDSRLPDHQVVLELFVQLLPMQAYTRSLWEGLVTSIGGLSVSVVSLSTRNFSLA